MDDRRSTSDVRGRRFQAGDPLRGLACLGILTWHTVVSAVTLTPPAGVSPDWHTELGVLGRPTISIMMSVWLFFALSGYLIAGPFVRHIVLDSDRRPRLRAYARNRLLRIVPAFWLFLTLTVVLLGTRGNSVRQMVEFYGFAHVFDKGPFTERMVQAWTLDVEVAFYVCVPLLLLPASRLLRGRGTPLTRAGIIVAACAAVAVASLALGVRWPGGGQILPGSAWAFPPGVALAAIQPLLRPRIEGRRSGRMLAWGLLAVALAGFLSAAYVFEYRADTAENVCALVACGGLLGGALVYEWA